MDLADFERIKLLGEGMFGEVWLVAADIFKTGQVKQKFALKSQRKVDDTRGKDALSSILREVNAMKQLDHPQIVDLVHTFEDEENVYMLMGLIPGGELWDRVYQELPNGEWSSGLSEGDAKFYMYTIADTLSFIHSKTYVFRDLKPENIMLDISGYPVLVDFGFAKFVEDKTYTFCGTPNYCAPEIILNAGHNRGVDLWALGVTLYEIITGENPFYFEGLDTVTLYDAICRDPPFQLKTSDGRSDHLISLVDRLLEKEPTKRLGMSSGGMRDILDHAWFEGLDTLRVKSKRWPAPWKPESDQDKKTQEMIESSMTASGVDGLPFTALHESVGSLNLSFHEDPIAEEETDSQELDDSKESFYGEELNGCSSSFRDEPIIEEALHGSDDSIQDTGIAEEESGGLSPKIESGGLSPSTSPHVQVSRGSHGDDSGSPSSGKKKKVKLLLKIKKKSSPKTDSGSRSSVYLYPIAKLPKKKGVDVAKSKRRSTISGALAGLGISGSDDDDVL
jgi:protein kinase A